MTAAVGVGWYCKLLTGSSSLYGGIRAGLEGCGELKEVSKDDGIRLWNGSLGSRQPIGSFDLAGGLCRFGFGGTLALETITEEIKS